MVFIAEKEFTRIPITGSFPATKFFNYFDKENLERYRKDNSSSQNGGSFGSKNAKTFGGEHR